SLSGKPNLNLLHIIFWLIVCLFTIIFSFIFWVDFYKVGLMPLICFIISSAIKGMTMVEVENRLMISPRIFQRLKDKKLLLIYENYDKGNNF
ncbi:MAG TPA: hypothetical protein PKY59_19865, partial [Pyrinomonadaceae bacterium]|nr:hypothetical protein [Pyrinomonadaceae bacterium]